MKRSYQNFLGIIICLFIAGSTYLWALKLMQSLYNYRSPLSNSPPPPGESTKPAITHKVVIILIDGLRVDTAYNSEIMPFLNILRNDAAWGIMHSQTPSYSEPGWTTILTGSWPELSDGPALNLDYEDIYPFTQDNIFSAAHRYGLKTAISGYYWFEKLLPAGSVDYFFYTKGEDDKADQAVLAAALPWFTNNDINLILVHIDQVDYAGHHQGGPQSFYWNDAAKRADTMINTIISKLDLSQNTVLILSDHGQIDSGGHGGKETVVLTVPYLFSGKGIIPGNYSDIQMVDIAPTISVLLGLNIPASNQGKLLLDILEINSDKRNQVNSALSLQQTQLLQSYSEATNQEITLLSGDNVVTSVQNSILFSRDERHKSEILKRSLIVVIILGTCLFFILRNIPLKKILPYLLAGILYISIFNIRYSLIDKHPYSLSWISSQAGLVNYLVVTSIISFSISWLLLNIFLKTFFKSPIEITRNTLICTISSILIIAIPVYISYAVNGPLVSWTLPKMLSMYLAFIALLQCLLIAVFGSLLAVLSVPIHLVARRFAGANINEN
ncbi:MAG: alkaline phosphatase family protein [Chloroflexota bacterium]